MVRVSKIHVQETFNISSLTLRSRHDFLWMYYDERQNERESHSEQLCEEKSLFCSRPSGEGS